MTSARAPRDPSVATTATMPASRRAIRVLPHVLSCGRSGIPRPRTCALSWARFSLGALERSGESKTEGLYQPEERLREVRRGAALAGSCALDSPLSGSALLLALRALAAADFSPLPALAFSALAASRATAPS